MKRLTALAAVLLALTAASVALAAGGPRQVPRRSSPATAPRPNTACSTGPGRSTSAHPTSGQRQTDLERATDGRWHVRDLGLHDHAHTQEGRQMHDQGQVQVQAERQQAHVQADQGHLHDAQGRPDVRPVDEGRLNGWRGGRQTSPRPHPLAVTPAFPRGPPRRSSWRPRFAREAMHEPLPGISKMSASGRPAALPPRAGLANSMSGSTYGLRVTGLSPVWSRWRDFRFGPGLTPKEKPAVGAVCGSAWVERVTGQVRRRVAAARSDCCGASGSRGGGCGTGRAQWRGSWRSMGPARRRAQLGSCRPGSGAGRASRRSLARGKHPTGANEAERDQHDRDDAEPLLARGVSCLGGG